MAVRDLPLFGPVFRRRLQPPRFSQPAVLLDSVSPDQGVTGGTTLSWPHIVKPGPNRVLYVGVAIGAATDSMTASVVFGTVSLTSVGKVHNNNGTGGYTQLFRLVAPPIRQAVITVTMSTAPTSIQAGSVSYFNVDQTTPETVSTAFGSSALASVAIPSEAGHIALMLVGGGSAFNATPNAPATKLWVRNQSGATGGGEAAMAQSVGGPGLAPSWTLGADWWSAIGADLRPSVADDPTYTVDTPIWVGTYDPLGDLSQFSLDTSSYLPSSPTVGSTSPAPFSGSFRGAYSVPAGTSVAGVGVNPRCENTWGGPRDFAEGDDYWIAGHVYLDPSFPDPAPGQFSVVFQFKNEDTGSPPLELSVNNDTSPAHWRIDGGFGYPGTSQQWVALDDTANPATHGVWTSWVFHVKFSSDPNIGMFSAWLNNNLVVDSYKSPTLASTLYPAQTSYLKVGYYRSEAITAAGTVFHDQWFVGRTATSVGFFPTVALADTASGSDSLTVYKTTISNDGEGTNGATVTTSSGSPNPFDAVTASGGATLTLDNTHVNSGSTAILQAVSTVASTGYLAWQTASTGGATPNAWARLYLYLTAYPTVNVRLAAFYGTSTTRCGLTLLTTGAIRTTNSGGGAVASTTGLIPLNTWVRVEFQATGISGGTGTVAARFYSGANLNTLTPDTNGSISTAGASVTAQVDEVRFGASASVTMTSAWNLWEDDLAFSNVAMPPPLTGATVVTLTDTGTGSDALTVAASGALAETASGTDTLAATATVPLTDAAAGTDAVTVTVAPLLSDTAAAADAVTLSATAPLADTGSAADALTIAPAVPLADTGSGADTLAATVAAPLTDTGGGADSLKAGPVIAETSVGSDTLTATVTLALTDTATGAEVLAAGPRIAETGTGSDTLAATVAVTLADTATGTDALGVAQGTNPVLPDTATGTDTLATSVAVPLAELGNATDTLAAAATDALPETGHGTDSLTLGVTVPLPEVAVGTDSLTATTAAALSDTATSADAMTVVQGSNPALPDTAHGTDIITVTTTAAVTDSGHGTDTVAISTGLAFADVGNATDTLTIVRQTVLADTATGADALTVTVTAQVTEQAAASDALTIGYSVPLAELVTTLDSFTVFKAGGEPTPPERTWQVDPETRLWRIAAEHRVYTAAAETRVDTVPADPRGTLILTESRLVEA